MYADLNIFRLETKVWLEILAEWEINGFFIITQIKKPRLCSVLL